MTAICWGRQKAAVNRLRALADIIEAGEYGTGDYPDDDGIAEAIEDLADAARRTPKETDDDDDAD